MSITELSDLFLSWVVIYGAPMLMLVLFLGAMGIPLPGTLFVIAAGAFVRQDVLPLGATFGLALLGAGLGDTFSYGVGRWAKQWIESKWGTSPMWRRATDQFQRRGGFAIYITRWLLTPIAIPTNLVAGGSGYAFPRFLAYDVSGEATWLLLYGGLGYAFGSQWEVISQFVSDFSGVIVGAIVVGIGIYVAFKPSGEKEGVWAEEQEV